MKNKYYFTLTILLLFSIQIVLAQKTVTGTVTDDTGPLPGVSILIKGTTKGVETDFDGNYAIEANVGNTLLFSFVGMETIEKKVGNANVINVVMKVSSENVLEEVVVTALGIKREKKALGYAVSAVDTDEIQSKPEADISRVLQGKVAGVNITPTGGMVGSGNTVIIRSKVSISGNNQPLYIVDGVPFNGNTDSSDGFTGFTGSSASSRSLDIDPNNIESISILKGLSATVLYGNEGRNGVILITTKNGNTEILNKGFEVTLSQNTSFNQIANLPDYQNKYGQGAGLNYNNGYIGNWGPEFDRDMLVPHIYDKEFITDIFPEYDGLMVPYVAVPNNVKDFFRIGLGSNTSVNVSKGGENSSTNFNASYANEDGYLPENNFQRLTIGLGNNIKLSNKLNFITSLNYTNTIFKAPPISAANGVNLSSSVFSRTLYIPRNYDLMNLPFENPLTGENIYYRDDLDNPRWLLKNAGATQGVDRVFGKAELNFNMSKNLNLTYRLGLDQFTESIDSYSNKGGWGSESTRLGYLREATGLNKILDHSLILTGSNFDFGENYNMNFILGFNAKNQSYDYQHFTYTQQINYGWLHPDNFGGRSHYKYLQEENTLGVYAQMEMDFFKSVFVTLAARNDWTSTVEPENRSILYPSASVSFLPTTAFDGLKGDFLNFLKIRGGYATSAGFPDPYGTRPILSIDTNTNAGSNGTIVAQEIGNTLPNPNIKPELHKEIEVGLEAKLLKNRIDIDLSLYDRNSTNQIISGAPLDPATGYFETNLNVGAVETKGIELGLGIKPIKNDNLIWDLTTNFTAYESTVTDIGDFIDQVYIAGFSNLGNYAIQGQPLNVIIGDYTLRDENNNYLIDYTDGTVINSTDGDFGEDVPAEKIIGDPNPDWQANLINTVSYKGLKLNVQLEYTQGGDVYSLTADRLWRRGVTKANIMEREGAVILPGTLADPLTGELVDPQGNPLEEGEAPYTNTIPITVNGLYFINTIDNSEANIYDATLIRLREVSLTYDLPSKFLNRTPFGSLTIGANAYNLWFDAVNMPDAFNIDPEVISTGAGNGAGLEFMTAPSSKKYGFSIKATF